MKDCFVCFRAKFRLEFFLFRCLIEATIYYFLSKPRRFTGSERHTTAYNSIQQHTTAYNSIQQRTTAYNCIQLHTTAYNSIQQHTTAYNSIQLHTTAYNRHTTACQSSLSNNDDNFLWFSSCSRWLFSSTTCSQLKQGFRLYYMIL